MREAIRSHAEQVEAAERAAERGVPVTFGRVADDWLAERRAEVRDGELKGSTVRRLRLDAPARRRAAQTRGRGRTAHIMRAFDSRPVNAIDAEEVDAWLRKLRAASLSPSTRKKYGLSR